MEEDSADNELPGTPCPWTVEGFFFFIFYLPTFVEKFQPLLFITFSVFNQHVVCWL